MPVTRRVLLLALLCLVVVPGAASAAEGHWTIAEVTGPPGTTRVQPWAVNDADTVVGIAQFPGQTKDMPFVWKDGVMTELPLPAGLPLNENPTELAVASDINDEGEIVGLVNTKYGGAQNSIAVRWVDDVPTALSCCFDGSLGTGLGSAAGGINSQGAIAGGAQRTYMGAPTVDPAVLLPGSATWSELGDFEGPDRGVFAMKINDAGEVLVKEGLGPDRAVVFGGVGRTVVEVEPGFQGFNDLGHVAGRTPYVSGHTQTARLWVGSGYEELSTSASIANAVNDSDWAVGNVAGIWAYLWRPGVAATNLNSLIDPASGWGLDNATDINDAGAVVGTGQHGSSGEIGYLASPAGQAFKLTGRVTDATGAPVAGVTVAVRSPEGQEYRPAGPVVTDADGKYTWTLPRGRWIATAMPSGTYALAPGNECLSVSGPDCVVEMDRDRTADFVDGSGGGGGGGGGGGPAPGPGGQTGGSPSSTGGARGGTAGGGAKPATLKVSGLKIAPKRVGDTLTIGSLAAGSAPPHTKVTVTVSLGKTTVASGTAKVKERKATGLTAKLTRTGRSKLAGRGRHKLQARIHLAAPGGATATVTRTVEL